LKLWALNALFAATLAACGGSDGDGDTVVTPTPTPAPSPAPAPVPAELTASYTVATPVGQTAGVVADVFAAVGQAVQSGSAYISKASTNNLITCTLSQDAHGVYALTLAPLTTQTVEASDACEAKATTSGGDNLTVAIQAQLDTLAPRVQYTTKVVTGYDEGVAGSVNITSLLGQITDASGTSIAIPTASLPPGYTYDAETGKLSWNTAAVAGTSTGYVMDAAGNKTTFQVLVNLASPYVPPVVTPPTTPTCPPGTVYDNGGCI
jgi:hypothetical protein